MFDQQLDAITGDLTMNFVNMFKQKEPEKAIYQNLTDKYHTQKPTPASDNGYIAIR